MPMLSIEVVLKRKPPGFQEEEEESPPSHPLHAPHNSQWRVEEMDEGQGLGRGPVTVLLWSVAAAGCPRAC
jgi:hypothetical protein